MSLEQTDSPWTATDVVSVQHARVLGAIHKSSHKLMSHCPRVAVGGFTRRGIGPLSVGLLTQVWGMGATAGGPCPVCDGWVYPLEFGTELDPELLVGYCTTCGQCAHRVMRGEPLSPREILEKAIKEQGWGRPIGMAGLEPVPDITPGDWQPILAALAEWGHEGLVRRR